MFFILQNHNCYQTKYRPLCSRTDLYSQELTKIVQFYNANKLYVYII